MGTTFTRMSNASTSSLAHFLYSIRSVSRFSLPKQAAGDHGFGGDEEEGYRSEDLDEIHEHEPDDAFESAEDIVLSPAVLAEDSAKSLVSALRLEMNPTLINVELNSLYRVDREMDVIAVAQAMFTDILARQMAVLRRRHNSLLPINKLPIELLAHIFSMSIQSQTWSVKALSNLASVCSTWWRVVVSTPSLWTTVRMFNKPELAVRKSKALPITLRVQDTPHSEGDMKRFAVTVGPHVQRWQYVFVQSSALDPLLVQLRNPLPQLEGLSLGYSGDWGGVSKHLTLGDAPKLRHLRLSKITVNWSMLTELSLETLSIMSLGQAHVPMLHELYQALKASPQLTSLALGKLEEFADVEGFEAEPLHMENLHTLKIWEVGQGTLVGLAKFLKAKNLQTLTILVQIRSGSEVSGFQKILGPAPNDGFLSTIVRNRGWKVIYAKIWPTRLELSETKRMDGSKPSPLSIHIRGATGFQLLLFLGPFGRGYSIDLDITESRMNDEDLQQVLYLLDPSVLRLGSAHVVPAMLALATVPTRPQKWACPHLQELHLTATESNLDTISTALALRNGWTENGSKCKLQVFNKVGEVFSTETDSFRPRKRPFSTRTIC